MSERNKSASLVCLGMLMSFIVMATAWGVVFDDPDNFGVKRTWAGSSVSVAGNLGGMLFSGDGQTLYVVGNSETSYSALYAVPLTRDPVTKEVTDMGPAANVTVVFNGAPGIAGLDAGWEIGPGGTLFYTYWSANYLGERPGGVSGAETLYSMGDISLPSSVAGLAFSPYIQDANTNFGVMQVSVWGGNRTLYNIPLTPLGGGLFQPQGPEVFVNLPRQGTGAIQYVPSGPLQGDMMYVNWDYGEIVILEIDDATGLPIDDTTGVPTKGTSSPRTQRFASGLGVGPWGLEFDPLTNDFFVSTWGGSPSNTVIQIGGKGLPPPELRITTESLPNGVMGEPYNQTVEATGGVGPYTWNIGSGGLPSNLILDPATGTISGTPLFYGTSYVRIRVRDSGEPAQIDEKDFDLVINPSVQPPALQVSSRSVEFPEACLGGANPPDQTIEVWNAGGGKLYWLVTINPESPDDLLLVLSSEPLQDDTSWLKVQPTSGSSTGPENRTTVTFSADVSAIEEAGDYTAIVRFYDQTAPEEGFIDVGVRLTVEVCAEPDLEVEPNEVEFQDVCAGGANPPDETVEVWNAGTGTVNWTATVHPALRCPDCRQYFPCAPDVEIEPFQDAGWLSVDPLSGTSTGPADRTTVALKVNIAGLADGEYLAAVRFSNNDNPDEDFEYVMVALRVGPSTITARSNFAADYVLRRLADGQEIESRTQPTSDVKVFENIHTNVAAGQWSIEWKAQANAWPRKPAIETQILPGCGNVTFTKDYIVRMPSELYQLTKEPIDYATGLFTVRVRITNATGEANPPARTFTAPIWLVVKGITFTIAGPNSEGRLWNADGLTSAQYPNSGDYYYKDVSAWAPLGPGQTSPEILLVFYIKDRNPNFQPVIEVWANDPVGVASSQFRAECARCQPTGSVLVTWNSESGCAYIVEAADTPGGPWAEVSKPVRPVGRSGEWADSPPEDARCRFYRVRLLSP